MVILFVTGVAMIVPDFTDLLNIGGSLGAGMIAFVFPPLLYNIQFADTITPAIKWSNIAIVAFGLIGSALSIYASILNIIDGASDSNTWLAEASKEKCTGIIHNIQTLSLMIDRASDSN
jgi:hypothetical protein